MKKKISINPLFSAVIALMITTTTTYAKSITTFFAQGGDFNLTEFIPDAVNGNLDMDSTYFAGLNYADEINIPIVREVMGAFISKDLIKTQVEYQITKHHGLQSNFESHAALALRSKDFRYYKNNNFNIASAIGLSYAFGDPMYEDTETGAEDAKRYKLQQYMAFEIDFGTSDSNWSMPIRLHHRSGAYGLIAPKGVGSNFISVGLRKDF